MCLLRLCICVCVSDGSFLWYAVGKWSNRQIMLRSSMRYFGLTFESLSPSGALASHHTSIQSTYGEDGSMQLYQQTRRLLLHDLFGQFGFRWPGSHESSHESSMRHPVLCTEINDIHYRSIDTFWHSLNLGQPHVRYQCTMEAVGIATILSCN